MAEEKKLILIVDDNSQNLQFLGNLLSENGYSIGFARNGLEAIQFVKTKLPGLILLDIMMPEMDGYEACEKLKSIPEFRHIPVIFLSAKSETADIVKGFKVGGVDYVTKPFIAEELLARVNTHIELKILQGLLPVCAKCKKIRDEEGYWQEMEHYFASHADLEFSHGMCRTCADDLYGDFDWYQEGKKKGRFSE